MLLRLITSVPIPLVIINLIRDMLVLSLVIFNFVNELLMVAGVTLVGFCLTRRRHLLTAR